MDPDGGRWEQRHPAKERGWSERATVRKILAYARLVERPKSGDNLQQSFRFAGKIGVPLIIVNVNPLKPVAIIEEKGSTAAMVNEQAAKEAVERGDESIALLGVTTCDPTRRSFVAGVALEWKFISKALARKDQRDSELLAGSAVLGSE